VTVINCPSDFRVYELVVGLINILVMVLDRMIKIVDGCSDHGFGTPWRSKVLTGTLT
jgi:hypothetical protein